MERFFLIFLLIAFTIACDHSNSGQGNIKGSGQSKNNTTSHEREDSSTKKPFDNSPDDRKKVLVCYHGSWSVYRPGKGRFAVEDIDPFLCTHVIYTFTGLSHDNTIRPLDPWNDLKDNYGKGAFERFVALKAKNPELKTLIAIGGWNEGSIKYSMMASDPASRKVFVESCVKFLDKFKFDGLDMDWEYPANRGGKPEDKQNFVSLLKELKEAFSPKNYLLTAAVSAGKHTIDLAYDIPKVAQYLDLINVMAYDYHGGWEDKTGLNAPLYARPDEKNDQRLLNLNFSINYWLSRGAPKEKIVLGMGTYGRSFTLQREEHNGLGAPAPQKGQAGPYTREPGTLGYNEICEMQKRQKWNIVRDPYHLAPYAYKERQWVGYDDVESITLKTKFANYMGLAGAMIWSIETDDFRGECGEKFPLLNAIKKELQNKMIELPQPAVSEESVNKTNESSTASSNITTLTTSPSPSSIFTTTSAPTSTDLGKNSTSSSTLMPTNKPETTTSSTSVSSTLSTSTSTSTSTSDPIKPSADNVCKEEGMFRDSNDCTKFYRCVLLGGNKFMVYKYECPKDTVFDENIRICTWSHSVPECNKQQNTKADVSKGGNLVE